MGKIRILIVGSGQMAGAHAEAYQQDERCELVGCVDNNPANLASFADRFGLTHKFASLEEAINWGQFDACSNVTPDAVHHRTTMPLLAAGKHVLCEKPLAQSAPDAHEMADAAKQAGVVNMVNLVYRTTPEISQAAALVASGILGDIRHMQASYLQSWLVGNHWGEWHSEDRWLWRLSEAHGSNGVLGDVGIHILDAALFITGLAPVSIHSRLQTFDKAPGNRIGDYPLDANDSCMMSLQFSNGAIGVVDASRYATGYANCLRLSIFGTDGGLEVNHGGDMPGVRICIGDNVHTQSWESVACEAGPANYQRFIDAIETGTAATPDFATAAQLQVLLDTALNQPLETVQT